MSRRDQERVRQDAMDTAKVKARLLDTEIPWPLVYEFKGRWYRYYHTEPKAPATDNVLDEVIWGS